MEINTSQLDYSILEFNEKDRKALQALYLSCRLHYLGSQDDWGFSDEDFDIDTGGERIWVAWDHNEAIGFSSVFEREAYLHLVYVHPRYQRMGIATKLMDAALKNVGRPVALRVPKHNQEVMRFFEKVGWKIISQGHNQDGQYWLCTYE